MPSIQEALAALRRISDLQNPVKSHTAPTSTIGRPGPKDRPMPAEGELLSRARTFPDLIDSTPLGLLGSLANPSEVVDASGPIGGLKRASELAYSHVKGVPGLYSRLTDAITQLPEKVHPVKAMSQAKNMASQEEISYRGLDKFLSERGNEMVRRDEILSHLGQNPIKLAQSHYGGPKPSFSQEDLAREYYRHYGYRPTDEDLTIAELDGSLNAIYERLGFKAPKYLGYNVPPTGKNYGETVINLETKPPDYVAGQFEATPEYRSIHWPDEVNPIVHSRYDERVLPGRGPVPDDLLSDITSQEYLMSGDRGSKGLFINEIQSDLHQAGRRGGYMKPVDPVVEAKARELQDRLSSINEELDYVISQSNAVPLGSLEWETAEGRLEELFTLQGRIYRELENITQTMRGGVVPDLPFKDTYPDLALKERILKAAEDPNIEWLGLNSPEGVKSMGMGTPEKGTNTYYGDVYPSRLAKLLKPFGAKIEKAELPSLPVTSITSSQPSRIIEAVYANNGETQVLSIPSSFPAFSNMQAQMDLLRDLKSSYTSGRQHLPGLPFTKATLTPEIKKAILERGFPAMALLGLLEAGRAHENTQR